MHFLPLTAEADCQGWQHEVSVVSRVRALAAGSGEAGQLYRHALRVGHFVLHALLDPIRHDTQVRVAGRGSTISN